MGPETNYMGEVRYDPRQTTEREPENDTKQIRQQLIGVIENMREMRYTLDGVADRFWGCVPTEASNAKTGVEDGDSLRGIHQAFDEARAELAQLRRVTSRFERLA